jgi:hypothetical protein
MVTGDIQAVPSYDFPHHCVYALSMTIGGKMGFFDFLSDEPNVTGQERERCLAYLREELRLAQFQEREADLNNNALVKFGTDVMSDRRAARGYRQTVNRLAEASRAILERRSRMAAVPDAATEMFFAWQSALSKYSEWASAGASAVEAAADGTTPNVARVQTLLAEFEQSAQRALKCEQKFVRRLGLTGNDFKNMTSEAARYVDANPWEPGQKLWATSGVREVPEAGSIYCTKCGRKNDSQASYCRDCGTPIVATPAVQPQQEVASGPLTMTATMHGNAVEYPQQAKPTETKVESPKEAKPETTEDMCRGFYDTGIFHATVMDIDVWSDFVDVAFKHAAEADPSFAKINRSQFKNEMTAIRMELFLLALSRGLKNDDSAVMARLFTKRYLEEMGRLDIYEIMETYNQMLAESAVRNAYGKRDSGCKAEALLASTEKARLDWYYAWIEGHISERSVHNPDDTTDEEKERLSCAGLVCRYIGVDIGKNDCIAVKMLSWRLAVHLGSDHKLKRKALEQLQAAIYGYYLGAEEYLSNPEKYQRTPSA